MATSFSGGRSRSTLREPPTIGKSLVNFITCGCESSAPFFVIYKAGRELTPYWWYACMSCLVIQLPNSLNHPGPRYIRSDMYTAPSTNYRSYYILPKAPTRPTLSYTGHIMKQSNLIKREQTGQSSQHHVIKSKHHLTQWFSTFFSHGPLLLLIFFGEPTYFISY